MLPKFELIKSNSFSFIIRSLIFAYLLWLYFRLIWVLPCSLFLAYHALKLGRNRIKIRAERLVLEQFRDFLVSISASLSAGATLEGAIRASPKELSVIWPENADIHNEVCLLDFKLSINMPVEKALSELGVSLGCDEAEKFAEVMAICKRSGGNVVSAVRASSSALTEKLDTLREIDGILSQRRLERNILACIPHGVLLMLDGVSPDYVNLLYSSWTGRVAALISLIFSGLAWVISEKIVEVKV